ncbi:hypothetical protein LTR48_009408, partial [Friedmanniomyces endolithicus]
MAARSFSAREKSIERMSRRPSVFRLTAGDASDSLLKPAMLPIAVMAVTVGLTRKSTYEPGVAF